VYLQGGKIRGSFLGEIKNDPVSSQLDSYMNSIHFQELNPSQDVNVL